jgi:hypothetical protein
MRRFFSELNPWLKVLKPLDNIAIFNNTIRISKSTVLECVISTNISFDFHFINKDNRSCYNYKWKSIIRSFGSVKLVCCILGLKTMCDRVCIEFIMSFQTYMVSK